MTVEDVIEVTATEIVHSGGNGNGTALAMVPPVKAIDLVDRMGVIRDAMSTAMVRDVDYGNIPGTDKPALLKPGAEKLGVLFQLDVQLVNEKHWGPGDHLTVMSRATVFHAPSGSRLGFGEGLCSTREKKYAVRQQQRTCPTCEQAAVIKGRQEYGGGWLCWAKKGGCGAKFRDGDEQIEGQPTGEIENPDLPDLWNTVVKMAEKRARVDAVLAVTGASALFTQDIEPDAPAADDEPPAPREEPPTPAVTAEAPKQTERIASAAQKRLINAKANERTMPPLDFLNAVRAAIELEAVEVTPEQATAAVKRIVDRLPARFVDAVLAQISDYVPF